MDSKTDARFTEMLRLAAERTKAVAGWDPTEFKSMLATRGGFQTVLALVRPKGRPSEGFAKLWERGHLELSVEALILSGEWPAHFPSEVTREARTRLAAAGFDVPAADGNAVPQAVAPPSPAVGGAVDFSDLADVSTVWRVTGPPENFITAITRGYWAVNEHNKGLWESKIRPGDVVLFHSTTESLYTKHAKSAVIGFAKIGPHIHEKRGFWWVHEIESQKNLWPYAFSLSEVVLFKDLSGVIDTTTPLDQKPLDVRRREVEALASSGVAITTLNEKAKEIDPTAPNFPVNGSMSRLNPVYESLLIAKSRAELFIVKTESDGEAVEEEALTPDEERAIDDEPIEQARKAALAFKDPTSAVGPKMGWRPVRKENVAQKRRIARLENHTCQVCEFFCEYVNKKGKRRWLIHVDHIIDKAKGGGEEASNLWVLCPNCHAKKTYGVIMIDPNARVVTERGTRVSIRDSHLGWPL